ncbi:hypothetical protein [Microbulbifer magnicolonia]|uniref:hypothetical protein n=1 Tax=Microbulbifer magnicolonia TaxID=3109744 RepID=UPI002B408F3E|nr:hypothetical protein [Microbulbifer sp. GG15]
MIYIHLGSWKTGTTTIQTVLRRNRVALQKLGYKFVDQRSQEFKDFAATFNEARKLPLREFDTLTSGETAILERSFDEFYNLVRGIENPIFSWEPFLGHPFSGLSSMYNSESAALWFSYLARRALDTFKFVLTVRNQFDFIESMYSQEVRKARFLSGFNDFFADKLPNDLGWEAVAKPFSDIFADDSLSVIPFEIVKKNGIRNYLEVFFRSVGIDLSELSLLDKDLHSNPSFSKVADSIALNVYPFLEKNDRLLLERVLVENFSNKTHKDNSYFTSTQRNMLYSKVARGNALFFQKYCPSYDAQEMGYI